MTSPLPAIEAIARTAALDIYHNAVDSDDGSHSMDMPVAVALITDAMSPLARQAEALKRRAEEAEALAERLKLEAQSHAQEARTANSTIYEIYHVVSGGKDEPGNWHGAKPVGAKLEALQRENAELREALQNLMGCYDTPLSRRRFPPDDFMSEALSIARALLGGENAGN